MKKLAVIISLFFWLGCSEKKTVEQKTQSQKLNVVELSEGFSIEAPSGIMQQKQVGNTTHVRIKGQNLVYSFSEQGAHTSCEKQLLDDVEKQKKPRVEDPENSKKIMPLRSEKRCDLHDTCFVQEIGQRTPDEFQNGKPFREMISYGVCLDEHYFILLGVLLPSGTPVTDENRAVMKQVVQSLKRTEKP